MSRIPTVGRVVHYLARGSADGVFPPVCRAAHVTDVDPDDPARIGVAVVNPTGLFFHPLDAGGCTLDGTDPAGARTPGSWHWPERA